MNYQLSWRGPERLGELKSYWESSVPEVGSTGHRHTLDQIFKEGSTFPASELVQSLFILKALAGTEKRRARKRANKLFDTGEINLDEAGRMAVEEMDIPYPILSYEQLRSKIPAKVRVMKKTQHEMKTEEELLAEGYTRVFEEPYQGIIDTRGTWRDSEGGGANREKSFTTSLPWEHTLEDLVDEEYVKEF